MVTKLPDSPVPGTPLIDHFIIGIPYAQSKTRGRRGGPQEWSDAIRNQTANLPKLQGRCRLEVEFVLPADKFPKDYPYGMDLDNLLKRLLDGMATTVFCEVPGGDSAVWELHATKRPVANGEDTGARIRFFPLTDA